MCIGCSVFDARNICKPCLIATRRASARKRLIAGGAVLVLAVGGGYNFHKRSLGTLAASGGTFEYGELAPRIRTLRANLAAAPCDRELAIEYAQTLLGAGDARGAIVATDAFIAQCKGHPRIHHLQYAAHDRLGEWDQIIAKATALIADKPKHRDYWIWRGKALAAKEELDRAASDYQQAITLEPQLRGVPLDLS